MITWTLLYIYLGGGALIALRMAWHIRYRLDRYDRMFSNVRLTFWLDVILWPLLLLKPECLIHPKFSTDTWNEGRADAERELDRLAQRRCLFIRNVPLSSSRCSWTKLRRQKSRP
ncbi:MAG: hypothetical protein JNK92_10080 [Dechloromonas sp.]|nr:hypothetical protein [Dechloromonas sp.]